MLSVIYVRIQGSRLANYTICQRKENTMTLSVCQIHYAKVNWEGYHSVVQHQVCMCTVVIQNLILFWTKY